MKLTHLANQRVIVSRLMPVNGSNARLAMATVTATFGHLQPVSDEKAVLINGVVGKTYKIFVEGDIDIKEADQLKDEQNNIYTVRKGGVTQWQYGIMDYKEVTITRS